MIFTLRSPIPGELLVAWQSYKAITNEELDLQEGDVVELLDIHDPVSSAKRMKLDPALDQVSGQLLDSSAARHKLSVRPRRSHASSRHSPNRLNINDRWLVRLTNDVKKQGWVPCRVLQTADDPTLAKTGLPGDAEFRRQAVVKELVETEQEFVRDLDYVVQNYLIPSESGKTPKVIKDNFDVLFGNLKEISEFHRTVLMDGVKYYANEPTLLGKAFLRLERDFDNHVNYCRDEHLAQEFLDVNDEAYDYFAELSQRLGDDKSIAEHLKLPIQRINDYQLLLKELVRYSACLDENNSDLQKALELMLSVPHRAQDDKFIQSIEGYKGSIHKLGRLLAHDRFSVTFGDVTKERYLFLFKARILICKVRRIAEDRSIFQLKDIIRLPQVELKNHPETPDVFELVDKKGGQSLILKAHRDHIKKYWLQEIREFAKDFGESEGTTSDEFQLASPPAEPLSPKTEKQPPFQPPQKKQVEAQVKAQPPPKSELEKKKAKEKEADTPQPSKKAKLSETLRKESPPRDQSKKVSSTKEEVKLVGVTKTIQQDNLISELKLSVKKSKQETTSKTSEVAEKKVKEESKTSKESSKQKTESKEKTTTSESIKVDKKVKEKTSSESTKAFTLGTTTTTTDLHQSNTLSNILTPESETVPPDFHLHRIEAVEPLHHVINPKKEPPSTSEDKTLVQEPSERVEESKTLLEDQPGHLRPIKAVEPLVHLHDPRIPEKKVEYVIKPPPELTPGSAYDKLKNVQSIGASDTVLTDYKIGVEFNVEVQDDMSRRYTSSKDEGGYESSHTSRRSASSYDPDRGFSSSRYSTETSSRYSTADPKYDSLGSSKYESLSSKYDPSKYDSLKESLGDSGSKYSSSRYGDDSSALTSSYSKKPLTESNEIDFGYSKRSSRSSALDDDTSSYSSRRLKSKLDDDDGDYTTSYSKRQSKTVSTSSGGEKDGEKYYSKRTVRGALEMEGEGDSYAVRRSIKSSVEGTGIEPSEKTDEYSYSTKRSLGSELGSKYSRRSISAEGSEGESRYSRRALTDDTDELINKYSKKYVRGESSEKRGLPEEEEDKYAKYSRKYSRTDSVEPKEEETKYSRRYSRRTESIERKTKDPEDDPYEKYARKYLRKEGSTEADASARKQGIEEEDSNSKYSKKYSRAESSEKSFREGDVSLIKSAESSKQQTSESYESSQTKKESYASESKTESHSETKELRSSSTESKAQLQAALANAAALTTAALQVSSQKTKEETGSASSIAQASSTPQACSIQSAATLTTPAVQAVKQESAKASTQETIQTLSDTKALTANTSQAMDKKISEAVSSATQVSVSERKPSSTQIVTAVRKSSTTTLKSEEKRSSITSMSASSNVIASAQTVSVNSQSSATILAAESSKTSESLSTMRTTREKSAEQKLEEVTDGNHRPHFIKTIRGTSIEPKEEAIFDVLLKEKPEMFMWLKDSKPLNGDGSMTGRIQQTTYAEGKEYKLVIKQVKDEDNGIYTALAQNTNGKASCSAQLVVHELTTEERAERAKTDHPEFLVSMKDAELLEGTYLRFMVKVVGEPNPDIAFFKDGKKITESHERIQVITEHSDKGFYELVIPEVKKSDAGEYKCVATNKFGEASSEAKVTVTDDKEIFKEMPEGEILPPGEKPEFHWKKDGTNFEPDERFKVLMGDDEDSLALVFQHVKPDDVGLYTCVAQTSRGHISCSAELTVHGTVNQLFREPEKPKLIIEKKEPIVTAGNQAMLELQVKGYPKPQVKWTHEGKTIEASSKYKILYEDEESMSLIIKDVKSEDAGKYVVTAENECGSDTAEMKLTVKAKRKQIIKEHFEIETQTIQIRAPPKIKNKMEDISIHADQLLKMTCEIEGIPEPKVQFYRDGKEVKQSERVKIVKEGEKYSLVIEKTSLNDTGSYSVVASNELAQVSQFWKLDVYSKPKVVEKLGANKVVAQGDNLELQVKIESEPKPQVKWYKDEEEVTSSEHFTIKESGDTYILRISGAVTTDAAKYKFKAVNIHGTGEDDARVDVKKMPKITKGLENMTVTEHDTNVTLDVQLEAFPRPTVKWYLDEVEIQETRSEFTRIESDNGVKLVIKEVSSELSGQYTCKLNNECGAAETSAKLTVNCAPRIIKHLKDTTVEEGATLHLEVEVGGCPPPTVKWLRNGHEVSADARIKISRDTHRNETYNLAVSLIKYEEQGEYEVIVTNQLGTVTSKSFVTVHKVTHTDAIEETEEPPQVFKLEEPKKEETPEPKEPKGIKTKIDLQDSTLKKTPEPLIEEPSSPLLPKRETHAILEEMEYMEESVKSNEPKSMKTHEITRKSSRKAKTVDIVEIETISVDLDKDGQKDIEVSDLNSDKKVKRGKSATTESVEEVKSFEKQTKKSVEISEIKNEKKLNRAISASKEEAEEKDLTEELSKKTAEVIELDTEIKLKRGISATKENLKEEESFDSQSKIFVETDLNSDKLLKSAVSATKETLEVQEHNSQPQSPEPTEVQFKLKRAISATKEAIEENDKPEDKPTTAQEVEAGAKIKVKKPKVVTQESAEVEKTITKYEIQPTESDVSISSSIAKQSTLETITVIEQDDNKKLSKKQKEETIERQISQKGQLDDKDKQKLQKQTSMVEQLNEENHKPEVTEKKGDKPQAEPIIMDTNMKDGSRPESLDVTYIVRGFANPPPVATWTLDGKEIKPDGHLRMTASQNGEEFKLEIKKLELRDAGVYECTLSNVMGAIKQKAVLEVTPEKDLRRPKFKEALNDQTIMKKNEVTFKAVIIGDPIPNVTWLKNGKPISNKEFEKDKIVIETEDHDIEDGLKECTFSLTIPRTERSNQGKYTIKAENKWGEAESSAQLTIVLKPEIEGPEDIKVVPGEATEFTVVVQANPEAQVLWVKDDKVIQASDLISIVEDKANETYKLVFHKVMLADDGFYKVVAKNDLGESTSEARLKTIKEAEPSTEKPKFITGINDDQTADQNELVLMVRADGLPKPEIHWFNNGNEILNDDNHKIAIVTEAQVTSTLTIPHFCESDVGLYKAVAKNVVGEAESKAKMSMLQTAPSISKKLDRNVDVNEGEPLELKAKVNGSPKPTAIWYKDGEPISPDDENIRTTTLPDGTVKLYIENCKPSDSGAYKLVVKNQNGETSSLCAVAVAPRQKRPKFLKCFKDVKVPLAQELRLEAKVEAYPPPEIKWFKDGVPVRQSPNIHFESHPDGRVALVVDVMKPENAGHYELKVSNKLGEASGDANVRTEKKPIKPQFLQNLFPQTVVEGFPVKLEVKAEGFPAPKITWTRNGAEIVSDNKHVKITDHPDGTSCLVIDACDEMRDSLTYKAVASNEAGEAETAAPLTVKTSKKDDEPEERPMFLHAIKDVVTDEGQPLILEAPFTGNPIPTVDWTKDGKPIEPSNRVLMTCDGRKVGITIDKAVPSDAGVYGVTITNPLGIETTQGKATVRKIFQPPSFTQRFTDLQQMPGRDAKFPCRVTGVPQPEVVWSKDGEPIRETDKYHIKRDGDLCCLYIFDCQPEDAGVYRATATNPEGEAVCTATLEVVKEIKVQKKIEPPTFLKRIGDTDLFKGMTAKFTACATGIPEPDVEWFHNDQKIYPSKRIRMDKDTNGLLRLSILGVDQDDLGKYSCRISNEHGNDICHATLKFDEGLEAKPKRPMTDQYTEFDKYKRSGAPVPISDPPIISQMTDRHCTLSWKPSIPSGPREPVTYQLEMCELPNGDWFTARTGIRTCTCGVRNLEPFRDYKFRVRVENKYGVSDPSPFAVTHRQKLEPDLPKFQPYLPPDIDFRPDTSPYFPKDFDIERPPREGMAQAPVFLRQEHPTQYGVKDQSTNLFWFVYGYPKPKITYYFNDELIEPGGRFDWSYTRNGQATLFVNKMLERDVGWYEAVARNEHGEARQRVRLEIAEAPYFIQRPDIEHVMIRGRCQFTARVIGVPYPEIKWYRDWKPVAASSRTRITFHEPDTCILTINDVIYKDEGLYSISARNLAGTASSSAMMYVEDNEQEYNFRTYGNLSPLKPHRRLMTEYYDLGDELGRGTQGITYHAVERLNGRNYAAKVMHGKGDLRPWMYNELDTLNQLRHKKLIALHDAYETDDTLGLILELGAGGELVSDYLLKMDYYTESDIAGFIRQLLQGLDYMHNKGFGHMGLNLGDLLIAHPGGDDLKITDFSLSRRISMAHLYPLAFGMPEYVSPECANNEGVGYGHDMWSVGIITYILLSGRSPFRGANDRETLSRIREGKWIFEDEWWSRISVEARDFISNLLVFNKEGRMDVRTALKHSWLEKADKRYKDEFQISSKYLSDYWRLYREWMDNASCKNWFRRRPLEGAFTHPSKMVYPPGECYTPRATPPRQEKVAAVRRTWEDQLPSRSPLNYEIGAFKSESHYQNGPDTYLLQLRDVDFPVRLREYMKVAVNRCPASTFLDDNGYDWRTPIIHERRRFTDIMDEEIDDERKARINRYGTGDTPYIRRLKTELGSRLDTYVEAEAFIESKQDGRGPFFREKPQLTAMIEGKDLELTCLAVGEPTPIVQWFKNDSIVAESHRIKIFTDAEGRSHYRLTPALAFDQGMYKVVARNKVGQTITRTRIVLGLIPDEPDSPEVKEISDTEVLVTWKQPKFDGNAPVICYRLEYKLADDMEWIKKAENIDHEFYLIKGLEPSKTYIFRLAARNAIGWSDPGVPTAPVQTKIEGSSKIQLSKAMAHLQAITDSGREIEDEKPFKNDYQKESDPVVWEHSSIQEHYNFISEISRGQFSTVLKAVSKSSDEVVVAKVLEMSNQKQKDDVEGEFAALRSLRHERIASLMAAYHSGDKAVFILEKLQGADVLTYLASKHQYNEQTVAIIVSQILDGLQYLHWRGLCHLDIQPDNVVMAGVRSVQVKLVDLGSAHRVTKLGTKVPVVGHPDYSSPEVLAEEPAFPQTDIWSVGVLTYVMLSGTVPFRGTDENETRQNILFVRYRFENLYQEITQEATRFLMLLFKRQPNKRPTPEECHENRWLLPTDYMIKKRERAVFLGHRIREYSEEYHSEREALSQSLTSQFGGKAIFRSHSIQEELLSYP